MSAGTKKGRWRPVRPADRPRAGLGRQLVAGLCTAARPATLILQRAISAPPRCPPPYSRDCRDCRATFPSLRCRDRQSRVACTCLSGPRRQSRAAPEKSRPTSGAHASAAPQPAILFRGKALVSGRDDSGAGRGSFLFRRCDVRRLRADAALHRARWLHRCGRCSAIAATPAPIDRQHEARRARLPSAAAATCLRQLSIEALECACHNQRKSHDASARATTRNAGNRCIRVTSSESAKY